MNRSKTLCARCFVPSCKNTTTNSPNKIFVCVKESLKRKWSEEVNLEYQPGRRLFCCEDHLNLEEDLENYQYFKLMKGNPRLKSTAKLRALRDLPSCSKDETVVTDNLPTLKAHLIQPIENLPIIISTASLHSTKMAPKRKLSERQIMMMVEFAERNRDIALGRHGTVGLQSTSRTVRKSWEFLASRLNAAAEGSGSRRTAYQWRRYWIEFKAKTKAKAANSRRTVLDSCTSNGGPTRFVPLTEAEERVLALTRHVVVDGLNGTTATFRVPWDSKKQSTADDPSIPAEETSAVDVAEVTAEDPLSEQPKWLDEMSSHESSPSPPPVPPAISPTRQRSRVRSTNSSMPTLRVSQNPMPRLRVSQNLFQKEEREPQYDLEQAHIAAYERMAVAVERLTATLDTRLEAMQSLLATLVNGKVNRPNS